MTRPTRILLWVAAVLTAVVAASTLLSRPGDVRVPEVRAARAPAGEPSRAETAALAPAPILAATESSRERADEARRPVETRVVPVVLGRVTDDSDAPVANAEVRVRYRRGSTLDTLGPLLTDSEGEFRGALEDLGELDPGERLRLRLTGIAEAQGLQAKRFRLAPEPEDLGVWHGEVRLDPGTTLFGRVVDEAGHPAFRAQVQVYGEEQGGEPKLRRTGDTDDRGEFRIGVVAAGNAFLLAQRAKLGSALVRLASRVERAGTDLGDIVLGRPAFLAGRVVDEEGRAVSGLVFDAKPAFLDQSGHWRYRSASGEARTDSYGRFEIPDLVAGAVRLEARLLRPGARSSGSRILAVALRELDDSPAAVYTTGRTDLELVLRAHRLRVVVEDPSGRAAGACRVLCLPERNLPSVLPALAKQRHTVPTGDPMAVEYSVTPGDELALVAFVPQRVSKMRQVIRLSARESVRIAQSPQQQTVMLRLRGN